MATDGAVFLLDEAMELIRMEESPYDREDVLQTLLERHPALIAGSLGVGRDASLVLVKREASVPDRQDATGRWSVDHLFVDADAVPMLVEVKRSTDTRIRREMIGQMLDYAANAASFWSADGLQADFETSSASAGEDPDEALAGFLDAGEEPGGFWRRVELNLRAGRMRLVFVADVIPQEVQRVVEFLNDQMSPAEVLAIEVRQYLGAAAGMKTIVPRVLGQTAKARHRKNPASMAPPRDWDEPSLLAEIRKEAGPRSAEVSKRVLDWARQNGLEIRYGSGGTYGTAYLELPFESGSIRIGSFSSQGRYALQLNSLRNVPALGDTELDGIIERYERVDGVRVSPSSRWKKPTFDLSVLTQPDALDGFLVAVDGHVLQVRAAAAASES